MILIENNIFISNLYLANVILIIIHEQNYFLIYHDGSYIEMKFYNL